MKCLALVALLGGCVKDSAYSLTYHASYGNAIAAPGTSRGAMTSITYTDYNGPLGMALLLLLSAPAKPTGHDSVSSDRRCAGDSCTTTTTTTHTGPTQGEIDSYNAQKEAYTTVIAPAILRGDFQAESVLQVAARSLGGDTSGARLGMNWVVGSSGGGEGGVSLKIGMAVGEFTMHGRISHRIVGDPMSLHATDSTDVASTFVGTPIKITVWQPSFAAYVQYDLNMLRLFDDDGTALDDQGKTRGYRPSITRIGIETAKSILHVGVELQLDAFRADSATIEGMAGFAF